ncbi:MAG TPA: adenylate/guanylate cyclase domain-containing protein [Propionibacteriaceae bacterium]|nr:adenylate/guanylate cyclase domain-containing protein [Propionibacteriaceae bacterium]
MATSELPSGTITFLFSDIEGSTRLLEELGDGYVALLQEHNRIFREVIREYEGAEVSTEGDSFFVVFRSPLSAVDAAARIQRRLADALFPATVRVRMGLHTGQGHLAGGDYVGIDVNRAARIAAAGHGGQILVSDATRALVEPDLPATLALRDLGLHRLKDLVHPERLYQLSVEGLSPKFPPLRSLEARPNNLPPQLTRFIGRQRQIAEIKRRLLNGARLLTLTGPGGTGKTRLAIEVAAETLPAFEDGAWFVDLASVMDPTLVISAVAEILGVTAKDGFSLQEALGNSLRDKAMLVVLDNFEQVVDAGADVERLLQAAPRLKVLVTSRSVLHRYGEQEFPVPPFALPDLGSLPDVASLGRYEAIGLFVERAAAVKPDFALTPLNAPSVAEIAIRLDGLPLAIELAASRIKILSPQAIVERLGPGSTVLVSRVQDAPARQRTLRATIEWSYQLLTERERQLFEQLSVFQGGATVVAIESICAPVRGGETLDDLASLVDNSLLRQLETAGEPRFDMLKTIKGYAAERLEDQPDLSAATQRAHATYFADFAQRQWEHLTGPRREPVLAAMAADIANLRGSWHYWVVAKDLAQLNKLVDSLWLFYDAQGWYHATVQVATDLLTVLSSTSSSPERAMQEVMLRTSLARALMAIHGYTREVEDAYGHALEVVEGQREIPQLFPVLRGLASFYTYRAEFDKGAQVGREILLLAEAQDDPSMRVDGHLVLGSSMALQRDLHGGLEHLEKAMACFESTGFRSGRFRLGTHPGVASFTVSALVLWMLGFPDRAAERATRAVTLAVDLGHPFTLAYALFHSGFLHLWRRELETVQDRALRVLQVAEEHDLQIWKALGRCLLGAANTGIGRPEDGLAQIRDGLDLYRGLKTPPVFWPLLLYVQAGAYARSGRPAEGLGMIEDAIEIASSELTLLPELYLLKGDLLLAVPDASDSAAESWFQRGFDMAEDLDAKMSQLRASVRLCRLWRDQGKPAEVSRPLRAIYEIFTEGFATADLLEARDVLEGR